MQDPLTKDLRMLNRVAKKMRKARFARGALTLSSPEVKFRLDSETSNPTDVARPDKHRLPPCLRQSRTLNTSRPACASLALLTRHRSIPGQAIASGKRDLRAAR